MSIQVFHRCRIYQADCGDLICCSCSCTGIFPFLFFGLTDPGVQLWFWLCLCMWAALRHLFPTQARGGRKQGLIKAHLLTQARERNGYSSHSKDVWGVPAAAEASRILPQCEVHHAFSSGSWPQIAGSSAVAGCTGSQEVVGSGPRLHTGSLVAVAAVVVSSCGVRDNSRGSLPPLELT